jgi:hypothetical protein
MTAVPEVLLQRALISGFRSMREDTRIIDTIFSHLNQTQLEDVKSFLLDTPVDFSINYPRQAPVLPSLALVLKGEGEAQAFLGDVLGDRSSLYVPDPDLSVDTLGGHAASVTDTSGLPVKVAGPLGVQSQPNSNSIVFDEDEDITTLVDNLLDFPTGCLKLYVVEGAGKGYVYDILRLSAEGLTIAGSFNPALDNTSVVDIRKPEDPELAVGEPSRVYLHDGSYLRKGVNYEVNYNLHVLAGQQEQVLYLYAAVKALFLSQRAFLEGQGLLNLKIGGSDFAPRTEFLPDEVFQRMMTLQFVTPFTFLEELHSYSSIQINYQVDGETIVKYPITL